MCSSSNLEIIKQSKFVIIIAGEIAPLKVDLTSLGEIQQHFICGNIFGVSSGNWYRVCSMA